MAFALSIRKDRQRRTTTVAVRKRVFAAGFCVIGAQTGADGTYTITGLYEETGKEEDNPKGGKTQMWGGSITSNTITVEVKKGAADSK